MGVPDKSLIVTAITTADSAGVASGFVQGIVQVSDNLRAQAETWRNALAEQRGARRWWWAFAPWRIWRLHLDCSCTEAAAETLEMLANRLGEQIAAHSQEATRRKAEADRSAQVVIDWLQRKPTLGARVRRLLGGAA